jgi:hypothetical protein
VKRKEKEPKKFRVKAQAPEYHYVFEPWGSDSNHINPVMGPATTFTFSKPRGVAWDRTAIRRRKQSGLIDPNAMYYRVYRSTIPRGRGR